MCANIAELVRFSFQTGGDTCEVMCLIDLAAVVVNVFNPLSLAL